MDDFEGTILEGTTPGPWPFKGRVGGHTVANMVYDLSVNDDKSSPYSGDPSWSQCMSNCRRDINLISAAPDMAAVAIEVIRAANRDPDEGPTGFGEALSALAAIVFPMDAT